MRVFAGDCVPQKKPAPDIYNLAAQVRVVRGRVFIAEPRIVQRILRSCAGPQSCDRGCDQICQAAALAGPPPHPAYASRAPSAPAHLVSPALAAGAGCGACPLRGD